MKYRAIMITALALAGTLIGWLALVNGSAAEAQDRTASESRIIAERAVDFPTDI
ncbi:MAG: hypothetical protein ABR550_02060 [Wenzhouxiangellaceae bacterium]